jgi:PAS domain S-box-containing protein
MSGTLLPTLYALSGVCAYAAIHHGLAVLRRQVNADHLLFALLSLLVMAYILAKAGAYGARTPTELVAMRRWEISMACAFFSLFPWFIAEYSNIRPRKLLIGMTVFWISMLFVNLILPFGLKFAELPRLTYFNLPWGESVLNLRARVPGVWQLVTWMGILIVMAFSFYACAAQYRYGERRRARTLTLALILVSGFILFDLAVNRNLIVFIHTSEFGFVSLLVLMDLDMMLDSREQKRRMRAVLDHLPAAVCLKDLKGRYQMINRRFEAYFNVSDADIIGKTVSDLFSREQAAVIRANELLACETRQEIESDEVWELNGRQYIFQSIRFPLLRPDGSVYAVAGVSTDITESRQKDEALDRIRRQVWHVERVASTGAIAGSLAHELSQPLNAILNNAQAGLRFMDHDKLDLDEIRGIFQDIVRDDKRAGSVINGLRAMLQKQESPYDNVDLGLCIEEVIDLVHSEILRRDTAIQRLLEPNLVVRVNKTQIQQVLLNLFLNALESMAEQAEGERILRVEATTSDDKALVSIRDTGKGIPEEMLDKVFDGFYTTKPQGLGVGLEVCRSIIESHHGAIWAEANPRRGVTFHFTVPAAAAKACAKEGSIDA